MKSRAATYFSLAFSLLFLCTAVSAQQFAGQYRFVAKDGTHALCAGRGTTHTLVANCSVGSANEFFNLFLNDNGTFALQAADGKFLSAEGGGGRELNANRDEIKEWEQFTFIRRPEGQDQYSIRTANGKFISAVDEGGRGVNSSPGWMGTWETFTVLNLGDMPTEGQAVNGTNVKAVYFRPQGDGRSRYVNTGRLWLELGPGDTLLFTFREVNRDEWSVYLHDDSRGYSVQLDLYRRQIFFNDGASSSPKPLYSILSSRMWFQELPGSGVVGR